MKAHQPNILFSIFLSFVVFFSTFGGTAADIIAQDQVYTTLTYSLTGMSSPVAGDYNGDGSADLAVFSPTTSTWYINGVGNFLFGYWRNIRVVADYNGDGKDDLAIFRPSKSTWYIAGVGTFAWGGSGDVPVPADHNGDGKAEITVFHPQPDFISSMVSDIPAQARMLLSLF